MVHTIKKKTKSMPKKKAAEPVSKKKAAKHTEGAIRKKLKPDKAGWVVVEVDRGHLSEGRVDHEYIGPDGKKYLSLSQAQKAGYKPK